MGITVVASTIIGIRVTREHFWLDDGNEKRCSLHGLIESNHASYCEFCGRELRITQLEKPTEDFAAYAKWCEREPKQLWESMWCSADGGVFPVSGIITPHGDRSGPLAIGHLLGNVTGSVTEESASSISLDDVKTLSVQIRGMARHIFQKGLEDVPIEIFTTLYRS